MTNQAPTQSAPDPFVLDYNQLGAFFYNPHPDTGGVSKEINGVWHKFGTEVVIVAGKQYTFPPQGIGKVLSTDPNYVLVLRNVETMIGLSAINDRGIRRIDLGRLEREGVAYLKEIDATCANILIDSLTETYVEALEKENESRVSRNLPPREPNAQEQEKIGVLEGLATRLKKEMSHSLTQRLKAIKKAAQQAPNFQATLKELGMDDLKRRADIASIAFDDTTTGEQLIAKLTAHKMRVIKEDIEKEALDSQPDESTEDASGDDQGQDDGDEGLDDLLNTRVNV